MSIQFPANPPLNDTFDYDGKTYIWDGEKWTASAIGSFDEAYVNISGDTMTGDLTVPSLNGGPLAGFRNQIINGDFRVWQRGTTTADFTFTSTDSASDRYIADRWFQNQDSVASTARRVGPGGDLPPGFTYALLMSTFEQLCQAIELPDSGVPGQFAQGTQWTFSYWCNQAGSITTESPVVQFRQTNTSAGAVSVTTVPFGAHIEEVTVGAQTWRRYASTFTIDAAPTVNHDQLRIGFSNGAASGRITGCQLEPGPVATPFEHRPISLELQLCQRYYIQYRSDGELVNVNRSTAGNLNFTVPVPVPMRISSPTIIGTTGLRTQNTAGGGGVQTRNWVSTSRFNTAKGVMTFHTDSTGANGSQITVHSGGNEIKLDAEL